MINKKQYLKNLLIVKRNLDIFLKAIKGKDNYSYFYYKTESYLEVIEKEIFSIKNEIKEEDKEYYNCLLTIFDFGA